MKKSLTAMTAVLFVIIVLDFIIAVNNIRTGNITTGVLLIIMALIIFGAAIRNIIILIKKR